MRFFVVLLSLALLGCQSEITENDYFPLQSGINWHYKVSTIKGEIRHNDVFSITNLDPIRLELDKEPQTVFVRRTSDGTDYYIRRDEEGSYRVAKRTLVEYKPRYDTEPRQVLPATHALEVGASWTVESKPYLLHGLKSHSLPDPGKKRFMLTYEIDEVDATVIVPAGTFRNCIKVVGTGTLSLYADPRLGYQDVNVIHTEWYAPGVGMIKLQREEPMDLELYKGGSVIFELSQFTR